MEPRVCLITGANSGLGKATAVGLARTGSKIVMVCRDRVRGEETQNEIRALTGNPDIDLILADLSSQSEVRRLAEDVKSRYSRLDVLVNNAGVALRRRSLTVDGIETVLAVNYLAPFLLTNLLLDVLKVSVPARVVNVAGDFHRRATIRFDDLMFEKDYTGAHANNQAKLALILFTYELARRMQRSGITANCLHPGAVGTVGPLKDPDLSPFSRLLYKMVRPFFQSPEKGAQTAIYLASSPEVEGVTGRYFIKKRPVKSSAESYDQEIARRLWDMSSRLTGLSFAVS